MVASIKENGFISMCTPFDENSVGFILDDEIEILKIASCSFSDWSLLEKAVGAGLPIVASTGGATLAQIDNVITFMENRNVDFAIQHCVGEYPTALEDMNLNQIDLLKGRFPNVRFGFSTHEDPSDIRLAPIAVSKGASLLERHVGVPTDAWPLNAYSGTVEQTRRWLQAASDALVACGTSGRRYSPNKVEFDSLMSLQRAVIATRALKSGDLLNREDFSLQFPAESDDLNAMDLSKYNVITATKDITPGQVIKRLDVEITNNKSVLLDYASKVTDLLHLSGVTVPKKIDLEISHHYGIEKFEAFGLSMITLVNREYCKKILICLPNQVHPEQYHNKKEETFHILYGHVELQLDDEKLLLAPGDVLTIQPGQRHSFVSPDGAVLEEISSTHFVNDSFYTDESISLNKNRKSFVKWYFG
jgi:sialic acid synthase SpsE/quercetin dioxygenase-like cupin family protein